MTKNYKKTAAGKPKASTRRGSAFRRSSPSSKQLRDASKARGRLKSRVSELESRVSPLEVHLGYSVTRGLELLIDEEE